MPAVQSAYAENIAPAIAGQIADMRAFDSITRNCESATIGFGLAVSRGTDTEHGCVLAGDIDSFLGVSIRDITLVQSTTANVDKYEQYNNVGIYVMGTIWVQVSGTPGPDDPVHFNASTGVFAASGGTGPVLGARWVTATVNGLCKLSLPAYGQAT